MKRSGARIKREIVKGLKAQKKEVKGTDEVQAIDEKLAALTRRTCARTEAMYGVPACPRTFVPELTVGTRTTQYYCSAPCAMIAMAHREGWPEKAVAGTLALFAPETERGPRKVHLRSVSKRVTDRSGALPVGTCVRYLGGSKAKWLPVDTVGIITHHWGETTLRYGLKFPMRSTVLGAAFVVKEG